MLESYYKLEISGKDVKRFIRNLYKMNIYFEYIYFSNGVCYIKVNSDNYKKIKNVKTYYSIKIIKVYGLKRIETLLKNNLFFLFFSFISIILLYFFSNVIFSVNIVHSDINLRKLIISELEKYDIKKYSFIKDYEYIQEVKKKILEDNKTNIEWLEIERIGTSYEIKVEKRIINDKEDESKLRHIVAKKSGIIMKIVAENGEIIKKKNDYVKEGEIIISGEIHKNDEIVDNIPASGNVYAEVWYKVKVEMPINYKEETLTGKSKNVLNINFLNYSWNLLDFNSYKNKKVVNNQLFSDFFGMFNINYNKEYEVIIKDEVNNIISEEFAFKIAKNKIEENLKEDEYIISQKKLKTVINNSTIVTEIFFKVYENISSFSYYSIEEGQWLYVEFLIW